jgi:uncharacterized membrane protein
MASQVPDDPRGDEPDGRTSPTGEETAQPVDERAKRPAIALLAGPYGHPFHPILVTVPIGAWVASLIFDIASYLTDSPAFAARAALWLVAIGVVGALAAAMVGFLDFVVIPPRTPAFRVALAHMTLNLVVTAAFAGGFVWRRAGSGPAGEVDAGPLALSAVSLALLGVSGFLGGKLSYHYGVRVADERTQADGFATEARPTASARANAHTGTRADTHADGGADRRRRDAPP